MTVQQSKPRENATHASDEGKQQHKEEVEQTVVAPKNGT